MSSRKEIYEEQRLTSEVFATTKAQQVDSQADLDYSWIVVLFSLLKDTDCISSDFSIYDKFRELIDWVQKANESCPQKELNFPFLQKAKKRKASNEFYKATQH